MRAAAPFVLVWVMIVLTVAASTKWSGIEVDRVAAVREEKLAATIVNQEMNRIAHIQESSTFWDEALVRITAQPLDLTWVDDNLGVWLNESAGHDEVYLINGAGQAVYVMREGQRAGVETYRQVNETIAPIVERAQSSEEVPEPEDLDLILMSPGAIDLAIVHGKPAIISAKPFESDSEELADHPGTNFTHVSVLYLDDNFTNGVASRYGFTSPRISQLPLTSDGEVVAPLRNSAGNVVAYLIWQAFAPGQGVIANVMPYLTVVLLLLGAIIVFLALRLEQRTRDLQESEAQARYQALHDALTGLPNRASFEARLPQVIESTVRTETAVSLLFVDIDHFKQVNDQFGHAAGDLLIRQVGQRLAEVVRSRDNVFRLGGDEFAVIQQHPVDGLIVERICKRIVEQIGRPFELLGTHAYVGASVGVATGPEHGNNSAELSRKADIALYIAKELGRGRSVRFEQRMDDDAVKRADFDRDMRSAMTAREEQLKIQYQPIFSTETSTIVGMEALLRWHHPTRGTLTPATFGHYAEDSGLIMAIGRHVIETAINEAKHWPDIRLAINVSPTQMRDRSFCATIEDILHQSGFDPARLELEIIESALLSRGVEVASTIRRLRGLGITIALDDFGTGFSSLSHIREIEVDRIKIDRSFISAINETRGISMVQAIVTMAQGYGLKVTAEGVESETQRELLRSLGCQEVQGYLLSRPVYGDAVAALFETADAVRRQAG